jgi:hypothetical protein
MDDKVVIEIRIAAQASAKLWDSYYLLNECAILFARGVLPHVSRGFGFQIN